MFVPFIALVVSVEKKLYSTLSLSTQASDTFRKPDKTFWVIKPSDRLAFHVKFPVASCHSTPQKPGYAPTCKTEGVALHEVLTAISTATNN